LQLLATHNKFQVLALGSGFTAKYVHMFLKRRGSSISSSLFWNLLAEYIKGFF